MDQVNASGWVTLADYCVTGSMCPLVMTPRTLAPIYSYTNAVASRISSLLLICFHLKAGRAAFHSALIKKIKDAKKDAEKKKETPTNWSEFLIKTNFNFGKNLEGDRIFAYARGVFPDKEDGPFAVCVRSHHCLPGHCVTVIITKDGGPPL